jgi:hypothetical protein
MEIGSNKTESQDRTLKSGIDQNQIQNQPQNEGEMKQTELSYSEQLLANGWCPIKKE